MKDAFGMARFILHPSCFVLSSKFGRTLDESGEEFASGADVEPFVDRFDVDVDGMPGDAEVGGDLLLAVPGEQPIKRLPGSWGEIGKLWGGDFFGSERG
jgi:hypothetical protein